MSIGSYSHSEISKLKLFIETFNTLAARTNNYVRESEFIETLVLSGSFSYNDCYLYIKKAKTFGHIYETDKLLAKRLSDVHDERDDYVQEEDVEQEEDVFEEADDDLTNEDDDIPTE